MAGGWEHTLALTHCGALFSFGGGFKYGCSSAEASAVLGVSAAETDGVLGKRSGVSPTRVCDDALGSARVNTIACGWDHCLAVTDDGALFTWGSGRSGQLGHGDTGGIQQIRTQRKYGEGTTCTERSFPQMFLTIETKSRSIINNRLAVPGKNELSRRRVPRCILLYW